jgi:ABC-type sulfate transport system permease subunit
VASLLSLLALVTLALKGYVESRSHSVHTLES